MTSPTDYSPSYPPPEKETPSSLTESSTDPKPLSSPPATSPYQPAPWPLSPLHTPIPHQPTTPLQAPTSPPLAFVAPVPEPISPFPADLPSRPAPARRGNFISRLFTHAPAHDDDMELGTLPESRNSQPSVPAQGSERFAKFSHIFWFKIAVAALFIGGVLFWTAMVFQAHTTATARESSESDE